MIFIRNICTYSSLNRRESNVFNIVNLKKKKRNKQNLIDSVSTRGWGDSVLVHAGHPVYAVSQISPREQLRFALNRRFPRSRVFLIINTQTNTPWKHNTRKLYKIIHERNINTRTVGTMRYRMAFTIQVF